MKIFAATLLFMISIFAMVMIFKQMTQPSPQPTIIEKPIISIERPIIRPPATFQPPSIYVNPRPYYPQHGPTIIVPINQNHYPNHHHH